jgi:hypothetical protein
VNDYPLLNFVARFGLAVSIAVGVLPVAAAAWYVLAGAPTGWLAAGILAGIVLFLAIKSYAELVRLITDMLIPK